MKRLKAGPYSLEYSEASLWNICLGDEEVIRRIYLVFQDINWTSRPFKIIKEEWNRRESSFLGRIEVQGTHDAKNFFATIEITGSELGQISFSFTGKSSTDFMRNRFGLCLLHPIKELSGRDCTLSKADGSISESNFPLQISPEQPFNNLTGISHKLKNGSRAIVKFSGEIFETEDHRNWSDASYKTYCTPISIPFPALVENQKVLHQRIEVSLEGYSDFLNSELRKPNVITVSNEIGQLPKIGICLGDGLKALSFEEHEGFDLLGIEHFRLSIKEMEGSHTRILSALELAKRFELSLDLALHVDSVDQLSELNKKLGDQKDLIRSFAVFSKDEKVTSEKLMKAARELVGKSAALVGGTDLYFTELNRNRECIDYLDEISFSLNPQVHSFDDRTIFQNAATQEVIGVNAKLICQGKPVTIAPITLLPRYNPNATAPEQDVSNTSLPKSVDARQKTWVAEAWTALSLKAIAQSGSISKVSYFETVGWSGLKEFNSDNTGDRFPVWNFFEALQGFTSFIPTQSSSPESVDLLMLQNEKVTRLVLINLSSTKQDVSFNGIDIPLMRLLPESVTYRDIERL
jgi:hypothetical protein